MSSTNRGAVRQLDDLYSTPEWCVHRLLDVWTPARGTCLVEPACGECAVVMAIGKKLPDHDLTWICSDIRKPESPEALDIQNLYFWQSNFLTTPLPIMDPLVHVSAVVTNPPYCHAEEFLRRSRFLYPQADLIFLLRLNFLGSDSRLPLWKDLGVPDVHVLPNRPSFVGGKTDSCEYAWMIWRAYDPKEHILRSPREGIITVLPATPLAERSKRLLAKPQPTPPGSPDGVEAGDS